MTNKYMYFIANWKMFGNSKTLKSLSNVINFVKKNKKKRFKMIYCPPYTLISKMSAKFVKSSIEVGGQNCHHLKNYGAYTGAVNPKMLKDAGAKYIILGHSENRQNGEDDKLINLKVKNSIDEKLNIIFCIGETLKEKRNKKTFSILSKQIKIGLDGIRNLDKLIVAYEPVWSIGTGIIPKSNDLYDVINFIKKKIKNESIKVLYGGSVSNKNIKELKKIKNLDGFLIGGASQDPKKFIDIIEKTYN